MPHNIVVALKLKAQNLEEEQKTVSAYHVLSHSIKIH